MDNRTQKERMLSGQPYMAADPVLSEERMQARTLQFLINNLPPSDRAAQEKQFRILLGATGEKFHIETPFRCDYGYNISIGENFYANYNCTILDGAPVQIGSNVMLAPNVSIFTAGHPVHFEPRNQQWEYAFPVTIGDNVWIGGGVIVNPGVTIGEGTVIGSGAVVTRNVPAAVIAAGNPCKVIRPVTPADKQYYFRDLKF